MARPGLCDNTLSVQARPKCLEEYHASSNQDIQILTCTCPALAETTTCPGFCPLGLLSFGVLNMPPVLSRLPMPPRLGIPPLLLSLSRLPTDPRLGGRLPGSGSDGMLLKESPVATQVLFSCLCFWFTDILVKRCSTRVTVNSRMTVQKLKTFTPLTLPRSERTSVCAI